MNKIDERLREMKTNAMLDQQFIDLVTAQKPDGYTIHTAKMPSHHDVVIVAFTNDAYPEDQEKALIVTANGLDLHQNAGNIKALADHAFRVAVDTLHNRGLLA